MSGEFIVFFFQAEDGIRDIGVTGVQTCALPILRDLQGVKPGDFVAAHGRFLPLPEAARPGGYDFARDAYFNGIGAVGSLSGRIEVRAPPAPPPLGLVVTATIDRARNALTRRIADVIGGQAG